jgi:hypothetical protein
MLSGVGLAVSDLPGSESWSDKVRRRARTLIRTIDRGYMELGELLYAVHDTPVNGDPNQPSVCVSWGYKNFSDWAEKELSLHRRKAERLQRIWWELEVRLAGQLTPAVKQRVIELGWSKVREVVRVLSGSNAEQWVEMAENLTHPELCAAIRQALIDQEKKDQAAAVGTEDEDDEGDYPKPPEDIERFKWKNFHLTPEQRENVKLAIERAQQLASSQKEGHCLDLICTDFLATNDFRKADDPEMPLRFLAKFERLMGKRIVVVDPETWTIEYGIDALQHVAESKDRE